MCVPSHEQRERIRLDKKKRNQRHRQSNNIEQRWRTEKNIDMLNECVKKRSFSFYHAERRKQVVT